MMKKYLYDISIIISIYNNQSQCLKKCLESIVNQTMEPSQIEVLLIHDGLNDNNRAICSRYVNQYSMFKIFIKENEGILDARNFGIKRAKGKYLIFLEDDDFLRHNALKNLVDFFEHYNKKIDLLMYLNMSDKSAEVHDYNNSSKLSKGNNIYAKKNFPYMTQLGMNFCIKNMFEENQLFESTSSIFLSEKQFCNKILDRKKYVGYYNENWKANIEEGMENKMHNEIDYKYSVSIIIPIYNAEKYIRKSLDSVIIQTWAHDDLEVVLVNDGSTDSSLQICTEYQRAYPFFKIINKENGGVSSARNAGICAAKGKYIMYLDADDELSENVIEKVVNFFDENYEKVDMVTYPERTYSKTGEMKKPHIRYDILKKTGIYDLEKDIYVFQARLNIATKNLMGQNIMFDEEMGYHEDQKYCNAILRKKLKIGFVDGVQYKYMLHDGSIIAENTNPIELFEPTTKFWEELFASFPKGEIPRYYQALYVHDLSWKLSQNCLLPYHYHGNLFKDSVRRLWRLLEEVDMDVILKHPSVDNFHRYFFLEKQRKCITALALRDKCALALKGTVFWERNSFELVFNKFKEKDGKLIMLLTLKSQFFNFHDKPAIYVIEDGSKKELEGFLSSRSYYKCKTITNHFWAFYYECEMKNVTQFEFVIDVDGITYPTHYYKMPTCSFVIQDKIVRQDYSITFHENKFIIDKISEAERKAIEDENDKKISKINYEAYRLRKTSSIYKQNRIWLYYDCKGVDYDNGYLQFIHDLGIKDGIERYYILNNDFDESKKLFAKEAQERVVLFGSELHKKLFIRAEKIVTAYIEEINLYPFPAKYKNLYMDIMNAEIVYLQHGILHASLPWKYTPERLEVDKVVASSMFEVNNFVKKYGFREEDIIQAGMPRFEKLDVNRKPQNRILFAPSWRMYLIGECENTIWNLTDEVFVKSKYFKEIQNFIKSPILENLLEENDLYLDFKIHPIFRPYLKHFEIRSKRINVAENVVKDEDYRLFITDFSSYVFNFAYIRRPIVYFVPDIVEFEAGLNQYRRLDLPFEQGFGDYTTTVEEVLASVEKIMRNNFSIEKKYMDRMASFFLPIQNSSEKIYQNLRLTMRG